MKYKSYIIYILNNNVSREQTFYELMKALEEVSSRYFIIIHHLEGIDKIEIITERINFDLEFTINRIIKDIELPIKAIPDIELEQYRMFKDWEGTGLDVELNPEISTQKLITVINELGKKVPVHTLVIGRIGTIYGIYVETHKSLIKKAKEILEPLRQYITDPRERYIYF